MAGYAKPNETPQDWPNKFRHILRKDSQPGLNAFGQDFDYEHELTNDDISDWPTVPNGFVCNPFDSVCSDFGGQPGSRSSRGTPSRPAGRLLHR